jgi:hypothetical protein
MKMEQRAKTDEASKRDCCDHQDLTNKTNKSVRGELGIFVLKTLFNQNMVLYL